MVTRHLIPGLGSFSLQKLTPEKIQDFYAQKLDEGKSPKLVQLIHAVLHQALENAVKWNLVPRNVAKTHDPYVVFYIIKTLAARDILTSSPDVPLPLQFTQQYRYARWRE